MAQLLDIFGFISVLIRGLTLSLEALTVGGVIFLLGINGSSPVRRMLPWCAASLAVVQAASVLLSSAILIGTTKMTWQDTAGAGFSVAGVLTVAGASAIAVFSGKCKSGVVCPIASAAILAGSVMNSHSFARLEHRWGATVLTFAHHLAGAAWIGGLLCLLLTLRHISESDARNIVSRFSKLAMLSVAILVTAGASMSILYVGSARALTGSAYGIMLLSKVTLTAFLLLLGALNLRIARAARRGVSLLPLKRFAEAEVGLGFTVLLAAASLTSVPPAIDVPNDWVTVSEIAPRMEPRWPRMHTPSTRELSPATSFKQTEYDNRLRTFLPGQIANSNNPADIAWSEYNHHWAGLVVLSAGMCSLLARRYSWARAWPLAFLGLAAFLFVRADAENWPLGPRGFWESFQVAEVAQHRLFVLLIIVFAFFECGIQIGRISPRRAGLVFPLVCAAGGALLMTHSHSLGQVKAEYFAELSHLPLAICGVAAGWARWLEIRLPSQFRGTAVSWIWSACFVVIGAILLSYRES